MRGRIHLAVFQHFLSCQVNAVQFGVRKVIELRREKYILFFLLRTFHKLSRTLNISNTIRVLVGRPFQDSTAVSDVNGA